MAIKLDLQARISLILVAVILPTFVIATIAQYKLTTPLLEDEMQQIGVTSGRTLVAELISSRVLQLPDPAPVVEGLIQELVYSQPYLVRVDVFMRTPEGGAKLVGSNVEDDANSPPPTPALVDLLTTEYRRDEQQVGYWDILVPIDHKSRDPKVPRKLVGNVHLVVSTQLVGRLVNTLWKTTAAAAVFSVFTLLLGLTYALRKTLENDRKLKQAESVNIELTTQLHEAQRQLMNTEKLAVMGQLTASFAHEIGTPLNAIGGHLQLLAEEISEKHPSSQADTRLNERVDVITGQVGKIEQIVKGFLQSTAKPSSQKQLVDLNLAIDRTLGIVRPRMDALHVEVRRDYDRSLGPVRAVPIEIEQILLNLMNNSLDSMKSKLEERDRGARLLLEVSTRHEERDGQLWAIATVYDTGEGIRKADLGNVLKPFFTTKRPGEGTGLGLTISQELVHKYGGELTLDSKEGAWARATLRLPYQVNA